MAAPKIYGQLIHSFYMIENILNILFGAIHIKTIYTGFHIVCDITYNI